MRVKRLLVVDATPQPWWAVLVGRPDPWWQAGAAAADVLDELDKIIDIGVTFDEVVRAHTPDDVYRAIEKHRPSYVEVHGHGAPGRPGIGGRAISPTNACWRHVRRVYFRSCEVARGKRGHEFMRTLARTCDVAAHVSRIGGIAQSYLVGVKRNRFAAPWWPVTLNPGSSHIGAPRTIGPLDPLPPWAFTKEPLS